MTQQLLNDEAIVHELDISHRGIEDETLVDNFQAEVQQSSLVEPPYSSKALVAPFLATAKKGCTI